VTVPNRQAQAADLLRERDRITAPELASALRISQPSAHSCLRRLVRKGEAHIARQGRRGPRSRPTVFALGPPPEPTTSAPTERTAPARPPVRPTGWDRVFE